MEHKLHLVFKLTPTHLLYFWKCQIWLMFTGLYKQPSKQQNITLVLTSKAIVFFLLHFDNKLSDVFIRDCKIVRRVLHNSIPWGCRVNCTKAFNLIITKWWRQVLSFPSYRQMLSVFGATVKLPHKRRWYKPSVEKPVTLCQFNHCSS